MDKKSIPGYTSTVPWKNVTMLTHIKPMFYFYIHEMVKRVKCYLNLFQASASFLYPLPPQKKTHQKTFDEALVSRTHDDVDIIRNNVKRFECRFYPRQVFTCTSK